MVLDARRALWQSHSLPAVLDSKLPVPHCVSMSPARKIKTNNVAVSTLSEHLASCPGSDRRGANLGMHLS